MEQKKILFVIIILLILVIIGLMIYIIFWQKTGKEEVSKTMKVKVFFNNDRLDPEFSCYKVFPVEREIPKTQAVARAALEELLKGPTDKEKEERYSTSIPTKEQIIQYRELVLENGGQAPYDGDEIKINSLKIENGLAFVDFSSELEAYGGGSCRVAAIRAQITQTLKQFPTVNSVIISINGRTEDILQP